MNWLERVLKEPYLWDYLQTVTKPIVLYGMGNGAEEILDRCEALQIPVHGIFASDEFVRGQTFRGFPVKTYGEIKAELGDFVVLLAFASERPEILQRFFHLAQQQETYAPHLPLFGDNDLVTPHWVREHAGVLQHVYENLADDKSRSVMQDILSYKLSGKLSFLQETTSRREDLETLFTFGKEECYADLGAYTGDTLTEFLELIGGCYQHMYAVEPDPKNFKKLRVFAEQQALSRITLCPKSIWAQDMPLRFAARGGRMSALASDGENATEGVSLDSLVGENHLTYVKMDVEGAEKEALYGGSGVIRREKPKLLVAGYHFDDDLWELPLSIWALVPEYKLYLRRHPYVPCWEINFFATL